MDLSVKQPEYSSLDQENDPMTSHTIRFGNRPVDLDMVQLVVGVAVFWVFSLILFIVKPVSIPTLDLSETFSDLYRPVYVDSSGELVELLKSHDIWDDPPPSEIPPVLVARLPKDLNLLDVNTKKRAFLHTLLPVVMLAQDEVRQEREYLVTVVDKIGEQRFDIRLLEDNPDRCSLLTKTDLVFLRNLSKKYRTTKSDELLARINVVPISLVLAQAAIESSWGDSRFVNEGNNLFGIWTWGKYGIIPARREEGKNHKVASYESILDSVRAYILILNRVSAYKQFRKIRLETMDSLSLANGLLYYSERRQAYVNDVKKVIQVNELQKYDHCVLASSQGAIETQAITVAGL